LAYRLKTPQFVQQLPTLRFPVCKQLMALLLLRAIEFLLKTKQIQQTTEFIPLLRVHGQEQQTLTHGMNWFQPFCLLKAERQAQERLGIVLPNLAAL
jgi:hypothetical protein